MDHILRLHVQHHTVRLGKCVGASSRAFLVLAAVAMFVAAAGSLATTKAALFVLSNAIILALLATDCRCFFFAAGASATSDAVVVVDACEEEPASGHVLEKQGRYHQQCAVQSQEEQEDVPPASTPEHLLGLPDQGESIALELEAPIVDEPTCKTVVPGLDELGIDELNKKFDEFIQNRRNKWMKEEAYLQLGS